MIHFFAIVVYHQLLQETCNIGEKKQPYGWPCYRCEFKLAWGILQ